MAVTQDDGEPINGTSLHPSQLAVTQELALDLDNDRTIRVRVADVQANAAGDYITVRAKATTQADLGTCRNGREYEHARLTYQYHAHDDGEPDDERLVLEGAARIHDTRQYQEIAGVREVRKLGRVHISGGGA